MRQVLESFQRAPALCKVLQNLDARERAEQLGLIVAAVQEGGAAVEGAPRLRGLGYREAWRGAGRAAGRGVVRAGWVPLRARSVWGGEELLLGVLGRGSHSVALHRRSL